VDIVGSPGSFTKSSRTSSNFLVFDWSDSSFPRKKGVSCHVGKRWNMMEAIFFSLGHGYQHQQMIKIRPEK
jgi:hypothetical protein